MFVNLYVEFFKNLKFEDSPKLNKFGNIILDILSVIGCVIGLIICLPFLIIEFVFGVAIWGVQCAIYKQVYKKTFVEFFHIGESNTIYLDKTDKE